MPDVVCDSDRLDIITSTSIPSHRNVPYKHYIYSFLLALIVFIAVCYQILGESQDWQSYDWFFDNLRIYGLDVFETTRFEPGFVIISLLLTTLIPSNLVVFGLIAAITLFLKCKIFCRISSNKALIIVIMFYFARFLPVHELTQLRISCALVFLLMAFLLLHDSNKLGAITACVVALLFHFTAIFLIPFIFLMRLKRITVIFIALIVFLVSLVCANYLANTLEENIRVVKLYQQQGFGDSPNPLAATLLLDCLMIVFGVLTWDRLTLQMKQILFVEIIGMVFFYAFLDFAVVSHRVREMFSVFWVVFIAQGLGQEALIKNVIVVFVFINVAAYLYLYIFSNNFFI